MPLAVQEPPSPLLIKPNHTGAIRIRADLRFLYLSPEGKGYQGGKKKVELYIARQDILFEKI